MEVFPTPLSPSTTILKCQFDNNEILIIGENVNFLQPNIHLMKWNAKSLEPDIVDGHMLVHPGRGDPRKQESSSFFFALSDTSLSGRSNYRTCQGLKKFFLGISQSIYIKVRTLTFLSTCKHPDPAVET